MFSALKKRVDLIYVYEFSLLALALSVVAFDFIYIAGNPKPGAHKAKQAAVSTVLSPDAAFSKSCKGVDPYAVDLKTVVQRGFCSISESR